MTIRTFLIGTTVLASLVGLGFLAHRMMNEPESGQEIEDSKEGKPDNQQEKVEKKVPKPTTKTLEVKPPSGKTSPAPPQPRKPTPPIVQKKVTVKAKKASQPSPVQVKPIEKPLGISLRNPLGEVSPVEKVKIAPQPLLDRPPVRSVLPLIKDDTFPLKKGSKGPKVERLNVWLTRNHSWTGKITDEFDDNTEHKLKRLTRHSELDEKTYNRMRMGRPVFEQKIIR